MVSNIAQPLASLINAKAKKKAVMCEWESRFVSDRRRKCPKLFMLVLKNRGWVGWRLEKILKMSEGSYVNFSYSKNYVQYLEKNKRTWKENVIEVVEKWNVST